MQKNIRNRTTAQAILDFMDIHGDKYDYSKFKYMGNKYKSTIICRKHGEFMQRYSNHIAGRGCVKCGEEKCAITSRKDTDYAVNRMISVHGDRYDYSKVRYTKSTEKVVVTCKKHGEFNILPHDHYNGKGCKICGDLKKRYGVGISLKRFKIESEEKNKGLSTLYIIKCFNDNEEFYKFGITNANTKERFKNKILMPYFFDNVFSFTSESEIIYNCELEILKKCLNPYIPKIKFGGYGECVSEICGNIINIINTRLGCTYGLEQSAAKSDAAIAFRS